MEKNNLKKFLICISLLLLIFILDRISKLYVLNLNETNQAINIYINSFININLIWNTGIGFGLFSSKTNLIYNAMTILIVFVNIIIIIMVFKAKDYKIFFLLMILGGSFGNLFDRLYFKGVPDFIDLHFKNFHWFIFNVADIFITLGVICLIFAELFIKKKQLN